MKTANLEEYRRFCAPSELHKAINMLRGLMLGITCDQNISEAEILELSNWVIIHDNLRKHQPFAELIPEVESIVADGVSTEEEKKDILWLCSHFTEEGEYYDLVASSIQVLHGLVHGVLSDGELSDSEIYALRDWLLANTDLQGVYPYDELNSLVSTTLADGRVEPKERDILKAFLGTLIEFKDSYNLSEDDFVKLREKYSVQGICSICPEIVFEGKGFCFTGESCRGTRAEIFKEIEKHGGIPRPSVTKNTDYLVVGNEGNPCWAFSCYGRKIEQAIALRKKGSKLLIVNETDFWSAIEGV